MKKGTKTAEKTFVILDAHALIHRSFHALPPFVSPKGEPVGAVYGVTSVLFKIAKDFKPDYIAAAFDLPGPTFRHEAYKDYKGTRAEVSPDIIPQFNKVKELFHAFDVAVYENPGFEADDVIGTLVSLIREKKDPVKIIIASGDLDAVQLVEGDKTVVYTLKKGVNDIVIYDEAAVKERFGFEPKLLVDYKGLRGDASDNIKGVPGIGEKTACALIQKFGGLEPIYARIEDIRRDKTFRGNVAGLLEANKKAAFFSRELATIRRDAPLVFKPEDVLWNTFNRAEVIAFLKNLGFTSLLNKVPEGDPGKAVETPTLFGDTLEAEEKKSVSKEDLKDVSEASWEDVGPFVSRAKKEQEAGWMLEEKASRLWAAAGGDSIAISGDLLRSKKKEFSKFFNDETVSHAAFEAKKILKFLWSLGVEVAGFSEDISVAAWVLDPAARSRDIFSLAREHAKSEISKGDFAKAVSAIRPLSRELAKELRSAKLSKVYAEIEMPLVPVLARMEERGIKVNASVLHAFSEELAASLKLREEKIYKLAGTRFNVNSPKQLSEVLFTHLGADANGIRKTDGGERSTRASELSKLASVHPLALEVMRYREEMKLKSTYVDVIPRLINKKTGRIHTTYNQAGTVTGRLSSQDPNLQNIPIRTPLGQSIRKAFVADKGFELVSFDYSQVELRLAASLAKDKKMIAGFKSGEDIHAMTAAEINGVTLPNVTPAMRRAAKTINFGILYGMGPVSLSEGLGITRSEASAFIERYFEHFPGVKQYIQAVKQQALKQGYVETIFGRRRYFENMEALGWQARREAERMAVNAPIQGSEADIIKIAMVRISQDLIPKYGEDNLRLILQVHDELLFEIKKTLVEKAAPEIRAIMEGVISLEAGLTVDMKRGTDWYNLR